MRVSFSSGNAVEHDTPAHCDSEHQRPTKYEWDQDAASLVRFPIGGTVLADLDALEVGRIEHSRHQLWRQIISDQCNAQEHLTLSLLDLLGIPTSRLSHSTFPVAK